MDVTIETPSFQYPNSVKGDHISAAGGKIKNLVMVVCSLPVYKSMFPTGLITDSRIIFSQVKVSAKKRLSLSKLETRLIDSISPKDN